MTNKADSTAHPALDNAEIIDLTDLIDSLEFDDITDVVDFEDMPTRPYAMVCAEALFSEADIIEATWPW
jgi:hypothetical protein